MPRPVTPLVMAAERAPRSLWRRVVDFVKRRLNPEPIIDTRVTKDDIRRAKELLEKHRDFLRDKR